MSNLSNSDNDKSKSPFDAIKHVDENGVDFWIAKELMLIVGYPRWSDFKPVVEKAKLACYNTGNDVTKHFAGTILKNQGRPGEDYNLSRFACYLVAMNGDPRKPEVAMAQAYFAVKTHQAEVAEVVTEEQQPVKKVLPSRDAVEYIEAADKLARLPEGILKNLLKDALVDQISLEQNLKYLPVAEKPKQYTIAKVRAKTLGYSDQQIGNGQQLGKFVKSQIEPAFQEMVGRYPVYHYEITSELDSVIRRYFA